MIRPGILARSDIGRTREVMRVTLGEGKADLAIVNATILNVYTGELLKGHSVSIKGEWIAYVGDRPEHTIGPRTQVINASGRTLIPGLIDGHTHLADGFFVIDEFLKYAMRGGTTTIVTETIEPFPVAGYEGVTDFLDSLRNQPIKIFATAPPLVSISKKTLGIPKGTLKKLLSRDDVVGLGESYWQGVLQEPERFLPMFYETVRRGKRLEGHSAGAKGEKLMAYLVLGISSCHEPINAQEVLERLRLGVHVMIREGSIRSDLAAISKIKDAGVDLRRLMLVSDGVKPGDLLQKGYMEWVVQRAIDCGFDPVRAIQMASINVAEYFSLDGIIGGIAPGRYADLLIVPDPKTIKAEYVISNGKIIAEDGTLLVSPRKHTFSAKSRESIHLPRALEPADFSLPVVKGTSHVNVRVIDQVTALVTKEVIMSMPVVGGQMKPEAGKDILRVAAVDRRYVPGKTFVGLIRGFGLRTGAIASSSAWDTSDIIVVGENEGDMAGAVNRIRDLGGGVVVFAKGAVLAEIPLPIFGIMADAPIHALAQEVEEIRKKMSELGFPFDDPILTLMTLTTAAIPFLRICEQGLVDLKDGKTVGLIAEEKP
jgi:adenine deaminase